MSTGGVISRRKALAAAGAFIVTASCNPDKMFGPCPSLADAPSDIAPSPELRDVYIVDGFTGSQEGTKGNPYSVRTAQEFDALMRFLVSSDYLAVHYDGQFQTAGVYRWGQYASRNLGKGWTVQGNAEISLAPDAITDRDAQPLYCLAGPARHVSGISTRGNHSALLDRWSGSLRTGGVLLEGDGEIDGVQFRSFGAKTDESFVASIASGTGRASITNCVFDEFDPSSSDTQVTVFSIMGLDAHPAPKRSFALMEGNRTVASGDGNWVQAHTIYDADQGLVRGNYSDGARVGYYVDFWTSRGITIETNRFLRSYHGIQIQLSPTASGDLELPKYFAHEDYTVGANEITSSGANVSLNTYGPSTTTRFIRNIQVHPSLSLESFGAENVTRIPQFCRAA